MSSRSAPKNKFETKVGIHIQTIGDIISCFKCKNVFNDDELTPRLLQCGHVMCSSCIHHDLELVSLPTPFEMMNAYPCPKKNWKDYGQPLPISIWELSCPRDGITTTVPGGNFRSLSRSFATLQLLESIPDDEKPFMVFITSRTGIGAAETRTIPMFVTERQRVSELKAQLFDLDSQLEISRQRMIIHNLTGDNQVLEDNRRIGTYVFAGAKIALMITSEKVDELDAVNDDEIETNSKCAQSIAK